MEQLEVRNLLATYENSITWTTFEDQTGDGKSGDDIPFPGAIVRITEHFDSLVGPRADQTFVGSGSYSSSLFWGEIDPDFGCIRCDKESFTVDWEPLPGWAFTDLDQTGEPCSVGIFGGILLPATNRDTKEPEDTSCQNSFYVFKPGTISGEVFDDHNGNGVRDPEDIEPIEGLLVYLDEVPDGSFSAAGGEPSAITDAAGKFTIQLTHAAPQGGELLIAEAFTGSPSTIYNQTAIEPATIPRSREALTGRNIGVFKKTSIRGTTFVDHNGNGLRDSDDEARPSTIVYVDKNLNGLLDSKTLTGSGDDDEPFAVSDSDGKYTLTDLSAGDTIRGHSPGIPSELFTVTQSSPDGYVIASDIPVTDANVGIFRNVSVFGKVYEDVNADGVQGHHLIEPGLVGRIVQLDLNNNGTVDRSFTTTSSGVYSFADVGPGTHRIHLVRSDNEAQTEPANNADRIITTQSNVGSGPLNVGLKIGSDLSIRRAARAIVDSRIEFEFATAAYGNPVQVTLYKSTDEVFSASDVAIGAPIQITPSASTGTQQAVFNLPNGFRTDPAASKLILVIDPQNSVNETDENNNAKVVQLTADISLTSVTRDNTGPGNTAQVVTANYELVDKVPTFQMGLYRSADEQFDASDVLLDTLRSIVPEEDATTGVELFNVGAYQADPDKPFLIAVVDPQNLLDEASELNNSRRVIRVIDISPLQVSGNFTYNEVADRFEATGSIEIGFKPLSTEIFFPLVKVNGSVNYDSANIHTNGTTSAFIKHAPVEFFVGSSRIDLTTRTVTQINVTSQLFDLGGLKLNPSKIAFVNPDGGTTSDSVLEVQGAVVVPPASVVFSAIKNLPPIGVTIEEPNKLKFGPKTFDLSGRIIFPPHMEFDLLGKIATEVDDLSAEFIPARNALRIRGKMTFPKLSKSFAASGKVAVEIVGEENYIELTPTRFDFVGALTMEDLVFAGTKEEPLFGIKEGKLSYSTLTDEFRGEAEIILPGVKTTLLGGFGVRQGEINFLSLGLDHLNVATPWLGLFLQKIQGQVDGLANPAQGSLEFAGTLGFTYGPETTIKVPQPIAEIFEIDPSIESAILRFETTGKLSTRPSVTGGVKIQIVHKDIITGLGEITVDFKDGNLQFKGSGSILKELLAGSFAMTANPLNASGTAAGRLKVPNVPAFGPLRNIEVGNANAFFTVSFDGIAANDVIVAYGVVDLPLLGRRTVGVRATMAGTTDFFFSLAEVPPRPSGSGEGVDSSKFEAFVIEPGTKELVLTAGWESEIANVPIEIIAPDGTVFSESKFDLTRMATIEQLSSVTNRTFGVLAPEAGTWMIRIPNTDGLGQVTFNAYRDSVAPEVDVTDVAVNGTTGTIHYQAVDPDSAAQIRFFYDTDNSGFDGILIDEPVNESDGAGTATWDLGAVPANTYFVYAMIDDGNNGLVFQYLDEPVIVGRAWQNPLKNLDANRNSTIEPLDVLVIVNELNSPKFREAITGRLHGRPTDTQFFYDPNGDGFCTPLDALRIINFLNGNAGEGELDTSGELDSFGTLMVAQQNERSILTASPAHKAQHTAEPDARPIIGVSPSAPFPASRPAYDAEHVELDWITNEFADDLAVSDAVFTEAWWSCE